MNKLILSVIKILFILMVVFSRAASSNEPAIFYDNNKETAIKVELFEFESEQQQQNAVQLAKSLRCPQCQNQNLIESNSPVAKDLRLKVYQMIKEGKSDEEIIQFMTHRFGDFVLYEPTLSSKTIILWFFPILLLILTFLFALKSVKYKK